MNITYKCVGYKICGKRIKCIYVCVTVFIDKKNIFIVTLNNNKFYDLNNNNKNETIVYNLQYFAFT